MRDVFHDLSCFRNTQFYLKKYLGCFRVVCIEQDLSVNKKFVFFEGRCLGSTIMLEEGEGGFRDRNITEV